MIAAPSLVSSSQFLGVPIAARHRRASGPVAARFPPHPAPRFPTAHYSAPAAERPSATAFTAASPSLYDVLGIPAGATGPEIKAAYRRLARACHPDVATAGRGEGASADEFMRVRAAYETLSDPDKRAEYDRKLFLLRRQRRPVTAPFSSSSSSSSSSPSSPSFSGPSRRTWETDQCW